MAGQAPDSVFHLVPEILREKEMTAVTKYASEYHGDCPFKLCTENEREI